MIHTFKFTINDETMEGDLVVSGDGEEIANALSQIEKPEIIGMLTTAVMQYFVNHDIPVDTVIEMYNAAKGSE